MPLCRSEDSILLIVDIQTRLTAVMPAKVLARLQRNTGMLLKAAALLDIPVFASEQYPAGLGELEPDIQKLLPASSRRFQKTSFSCAGADGFMTDIVNSGRSQIVLAGMEAHVCVLQTAMDLQDAGNAVYVVADAVCSRNRENYETALQRMRGAGITIGDAESVLFEWVRNSKNPQFKPILSLVR